MFSRNFLRDLLERAIATFAETLAALLVADGTGLLDAHWQTQLSVAGMATLVMVLKGLGAYSIDNETGASLLSDPPPRVEAGHGDALYVVLVALAVLVVLALLGVI